MTSGTPTVWRHSALRIYVALEQLGFDPRALFSQKGLNMEDMLTPGFRLRADLMIELIQSASQLANRADFGLYVGRNVEPLGNTAFKWAIVLSATPAAAIKRMAYFAPLIDPTLKAEFQAYGNQHALTQVPVGGDATGVHAAVREDFIVSGLISLTKTLLPGGLQHTCVELTQSKPNNPDPWYACFGEEIKWSAQAFKVWWPTSMLRRHRLNANEKLAREHDLVARRQLTAQKSHAWKQRVEWLLVTKIPYGNITQQLVAEALNIEVRTLQRNLKAEGTRFQELVSDARKQHATTQLHRNVSIAQIGSELGYKDSSAFSNAFKKWFGVAPSNYLNVPQNHQI
jgi:AraC-like DNA-binding protein